MRTPPVMPSVSSGLDDHNLALPTLTKDKKAMQDKSEARDLVDEIPSTEAEGPLRSKWRHTLGKDMLAFFILGIVVRTMQL